MYFKSLCKNGFKWILERLFIFYRNEGGFFDVTREHLKTCDKNYKKSKPAILTKDTLLKTKMARLSRSQKT